MKKILKQVAKTLGVTFSVVGFVVFYVVWFIFIFKLEARYHIWPPATVTLLFMPVVLLVGGIYFYIAGLIKPFLKKKESHDETEHQVQS